MKRRVVLALLAIFLAACQGPPLSEALPPSEVTIVAPAVSPSPTATPAATLTPSATPPGPLFPYTIAGLRSRPYPGGELRLLSLLEETADYTRYLVDYPSDGLTITGILQIPPGEGPFPVIVMNHGFFPRGEYASGDGTYRAAAVLNRAGYLTISPDYRSWGGSDVGYSLFHTGLVADVLNLVSSLPSLPLADSSRIGMWGHSMGGGIATRVLTVDDRIRAAFLYAPNSADDADLVARWGTGCIGDVDPAGCPHADLLPSSLAPNLVQAYLEAASDPAMLVQIAPIYHLEYVDAPVQIHIGSADGQSISETPPEWSAKLYQAMLAAGVNVEYFVYPGQGHSFRGADWDLMMSRAVAFFDRYVKGENRP